MNPPKTNEPTIGERTPVTITRVYDYPRKRVFDLLTDPKLAASVWGPEGSVKYLFELDRRPGGALRIHDGTSEGIVAKTEGTILEFVDPERFVFRSATTPAGGDAPWEALQTVTLEELGPRKTRVNVHVQVLAVGSFPGDAASLEEGYQGGWGDTFVMLQRALG